MPNWTSNSPNNCLLSFISTFGDTFQKQVDLFEKRSIIKKSSWEDQYKFKLSILIYGQMYKKEEKSLGDLFRNREELVYDKKYFI